MPVFRDGYEICVPTSVDKTGAGSSATINANGSVTFSTCETLSLNGVFSSTYDNYMIVARHSTTADYAWRIRFRAGTDNSTTNSYVFQYVFAYGTTIEGARTTTNYGQMSARGNTLRAGFVAQVYGPYLAQPTSYRTSNGDDYQNSSCFSIAGTHNQSASYDGITFIASAGSFTGLICVYGAVQ